RPALAGGNRQQHAETSARLCSTSASVLVANTRSDPPCPDSQRHDPVDRFSTEQVKTVSVTANTTLLRLQKKKDRHNLLTHREGCNTNWRIFAAWEEEDR